MCTIVFIPTEEGFHLAHNRDESLKRTRAVAPQRFEMNGKSLSMPIDGEKKGTWIYTNDDQTVLLFNGAYQKHKHQEPYNRSRGLIMLESTDFNTHLEFVEEVELEGVEPFTQLFINHTDKVIIQLVWDEKEKHVQKMEWSPFIFSSVTLYDEEEISQKEEQFKEWLLINQPEALINFMQNTDFKVPILLNQPKVATLSTTLVIYKNGKSEMRYIDYTTG